MPEMLLFDGEFHRSAGAHLDLGDHGVLYGYGLYETVRAVNVQPVWLEPHLNRLFASADFFGMHVRKDVTTWRHWLGELCRRNGLDHGEAAVRINITRGVETKGHFPNAHVWVTATPLPTYVAERRRGVTALVLPPTYRRPFPEHKTISVIAVAHGLQLARDQGMQEAFFSAADGSILEGAISNVFAIIGDEVVTPPLAAGILPGVTRQWVLDACGRRGQRVEQRALRYENFLGAEASFLTSTLVGLAPLSAIDGRPLRRATDHPIFQQLIADYKAEIPA